jgi:hypothetical protein
MGITSSQRADVFWVPEGTYYHGQLLKQGWYFWDEAAVLGGGPFDDEYSAIREFDLYLTYLGVK